ncbi:MAG: cysteine hydrolase family protein [Geminicoccaceae bacterium]
MSKTALLVIDVQRVFYDDDTIPPVFDGEEILARISDVVQRARASGLPIVYIQHDGGRDHPLEKGGQGWQIHPAVQPEKHDVIVAKSMPDSFHETNLKAELDALGVESLIVVGNQTEFCVDTTCRRACSHGYTVTLLKDAHSTWNSDYLTAQQIIAHHNFILGRRFVSLDESSNIDIGKLS